MRARIITIALASIGVIAPAGARELDAAQSGQPTEYELKALFLLNFTKFVDWPPEAPSAGKSAITIGIVGADPFGDAIKAIEGKNVKDRTIVIKRFPEPKRFEACEIIFVSSGERERCSDIFNITKGKATLTVGEHDGFATNGGMIGFFIDQKKLRFEINLEAAAAAGLKVSSQLTKLARIVKNSEGGGHPQPASKPASSPSRTEKPAPKAEK